jgi:hypothetical protein
MTTEADDVPPLRLSIRHLFYWLTATAVLVALDESDWNVTDRHILFQNGLSIGYCILRGICLASFPIAVHQWRGGAKFPADPGHWYLLAGGCSSLAIHIVLRLLNMTPLAAHIPHSIDLPLQFGIPAFIFSWAARDTIMPAWKWLFRAEALLYGGYAIFWVVHLGLKALHWKVIGISTVVQFGLHHYQEIVGALMLSNPLFGIAVSCFDRRQPRDFLHYAGIATAAIEAILFLCWFIPGFLPAE